MAGATSVTERLNLLDVLRGGAIAGMVMVHFHEHTGELGGFEDVIRTAVWRLVETKSHGTFALLFGAGFAIQMRRAEARGAPFAAMYFRRLGVLAIFGFIAHACFGFNVLLSYAVWGVPLLLMRRWSSTALIAAAIVSAMSVGLFLAARTRYEVATLGASGVAALADVRAASTAQVMAALSAAQDGSSYGALFVARLHHMAWFYTQPFFFMPGSTMTLFLVGALAIRHRVFEQPGAHSWAVGALMAFGVYAWYADDWLPASWNPFGLFRDQWLTFAYVGAAVLLLRSRPGWIARLHPLGLAGRMALTNYLLQVVVLDVLFSGYGVHLGTIRSSIGLVMTAAVVTGLVFSSAWWLRRFQFGPAEWAWRSLTYGRLQPMRLAALSSRASI